MKISLSFRVFPLKWKWERERRGAPCAPCYLLTVRLIFQQPPFFLFERMENSFYDIMIFTSGSWIFKFALLVCLSALRGKRADLLLAYNSFPRCNMSLFAEQKEYGIFTAVAVLLLFPLWCEFTLCFDRPRWMLLRKLLPSVICDIKSNFPLHIRTHSISNL